MVQSQNIKKIISVSLLLVSCFSANKVFADVWIPPPYPNPLVITLIAILVNLIIEIPIFIFAFKKNYKIIIGVIVSNILSWPIFVGFLSTFYAFLPLFGFDRFTIDQHYGQNLFWLQKKEVTSTMTFITPNYQLLIEIGVIVFESIIIKIICKKEKYVKILLFTVIANMASYYLGKYLLYFVFSDYLSYIDIGKNSHGITNF